MDKKASQAPKSRDWSKQIIADIRSLLWIVTLGGLFLAFYCIRFGYVGSLPWLSAMVGLPWTAHGVVASFYLTMAKSDHKEGGITYETAKANGFRVELEEPAVEEPVEQEPDTGWLEGGTDWSEEPVQSPEAMLSPPI